MNGAVIHQGRVAQIDDCFESGSERAGGVFSLVLLRQEAERK